MEAFVDVGALGMGSLSTKLSDLQECLQYRFRDETLLEQALTHGSGSRTVERANYQRLEFLGDRVLGLVIADCLFRAFPLADEGELSTRFNALVCAKACAEIANEMHLGDYIILGIGEERSGGRKKRTILADVIEAVIGAIYFDGSFEDARSFIELRWRSRIGVAGVPRRDGKTLLQEWCQERGLPLPVYEVVSCSGLSHAPLFEVQVSVFSMDPVFGVGSSKREAEQLAASAFLKKECG